MPATEQITNHSADVASRRILRLALGTALSMGFSQLVNWPLSFIAAVFTMFLLAVPLPAPTLKSSLKFVLALVIPAYAGMLLLPFLMHARWAGILLVTLVLYGSFYYSARGGSPVMGMFMTVGITIVVTVGSVSADIMLMVVNGLAVGAFAGIAFVLIAHALLPDLPSPATGAANARPPPEKPSLQLARRNALRSMAVVLPLVIVFLFISSSISYVVVMIKVSSMGQQANTQVTRAMGRQQLESTLWGGVGAIIGFHLMSIWSSLLLFCLIIGLASLLYGRRIFQGAGMHPKGGMWSYALLTMIIVLTPAVISAPGDGNAAAAFYTRLLLFVVIAIYGTVSVAVFDAFWPAKRKTVTDAGR
jgi:large-conductance mechanosensitive channel